MQHMKLLMIHDFDQIFASFQQKEAVLCLFQSLKLTTQKILFTYQLDNDTRVRMHEKWFPGKEITYLNQEMSLKNTTHYYFDARSKNEAQKLQLIQNLSVNYFEDDFKILIYCRTTMNLNIICKKLEELKYKYSKIDFETNEFSSKVQFNSFLSGKNKFYVTNTPKYKIIFPVTTILVYEMPQFNSPIGYIQRSANVLTHKTPCTVMNVVSSDADKKQIEAIALYCQLSLKIPHLFTEVTPNNVNSELTKKQK
ncbi:ATP-dependent_RNA helicase [Hexamita inflata]|uniref:ATP-dependent RNA helicase n=1 Tax=Hexamita inflata TaxID=28002 RepID=A0AA86PK86_9EUKA|nr:ATP-dependent RNA helicase [Hexamita inflata]